MFRSLSKYGKIQLPYRSKRIIASSSSEAQERDREEKAKRLLSPVLTHHSELVIESGKGCWVTDTRKNTYLDLTSGIGVCNTGPSHPKVVEAIREACGEIIHAQQGIYYNKRTLGLLERLNTILP